MSLISSTARLVASVLALLIVVSCSGDPSRESVAVAAASDVPVGTQALMVAFSDTVVQFRVIEESRVPPETLPADGFSYEIRRDLLAEVTAVLYTAPKDGLPAVGDTFTFSHWGWWVQDGTQEPKPIIEDGIEIVVGESYFGAFTDGHAVNDGRLNSATSASFYRSEDGTATPLGRHDDYPDFSGKDLETLQAEIAATAARPDVAPFATMTGAEKQRQPLDTLRAG